MTVLSKSSEQLPFSSLSYSSLSFPGSSLLLLEESVWLKLDSGAGNSSEDPASAASEQDKVLIRNNQSELSKKNNLCPYYIFLIEISMHEKKVSSSFSSTHFTFRWQ